MLHNHRALLIQDIWELRQTLEPLLQEIVPDYARDGAEVEQAFSWIIRQHIQECHLLHDPLHRYIPHLQAIFDRANHALNGLLERTLSFYIRVPRLYDGNLQIQVASSNRDLYIYYG